VARRRNNTQRPLCCEGQLFLKLLNFSFLGYEPALGARQLIIPTFHLLRQLCQLFFKFQAC